MAAAVGSMYEEKLSPVKSDPKEENLKDVKDATYNHPEVAVGEGKDDAVLDEIAAKVSEMDVNEGDPNHKKCMDTVKSQHFQCSTLINRRRIMFEEYTSMRYERDYYEELNEALFRCLELNERAIILESDAEGESAETA